jgi:hypothetical protein
MKIAIARNEMFRTLEVYETLDKAIDAHKAQGYEIKACLNTQEDWSRGVVRMERDDHNGDLWAILAPEFQGPEVVIITLTTIL